MMPSGESYNATHLMLDRVRAARAAHLERVPEYDAAHERERRIYGREADDWSEIMVNAIRALGADADMFEVYEAAIGKPLETWNELNDWSQQLAGYVRQWLYRRCKPGQGGRPEPVSDLDRSDS